MKTTVAAIAAAAVTILSAPAVSSADDDPAAARADDGRYLVTIAGCNDCHTVNWIETGGTLPDSEWLTGSPVGFRGPWGTTYASNLRLLVSEIDENAWVAMLHGRKDRPPMPWVSTNRMKESDVRAIYRFIRSLGAAGDRAPTAVSAGDAVHPVRTAASRAARDAHEVASRAPQPDG